MKDEKLVRIIMILENFSTPVLLKLDELAKEGNYVGLHGYFDRQGLSAAALKHLYETSRSKESMALLRQAIAQLLEQREQRRMH